ncbi:MAG: GreA/GreB family elongation factor [Anaeromyxobacteraceae bacterium]
MSKAFTSEETPDLGPVVRVPPRLAPGEVRYVTPEGQAALRRELATLPANDPRAAVVERTLAALTVLGPEAAPEGRVGFGTWVEVEDAAGLRKLYRLVGPDEADPRRGLVSVHAPVGAALLGREVDDAVEVDLPGGRAEYTVIAVHRAAPPER